MNIKRPDRMNLSPDQLRWLGLAGLALFVPGGLPVVLLLVARHYRNKLRLPQNLRFLKAGETR